MRQDLVFNTIFAAPAFHRAMLETLMRLQYARRYSGEWTGHSTVCAHPGMAFILNHVLKVGPGELPKIDSTRLHFILLCEQWNV